MGKRGKLRLVSHNRVRRHFPQAYGSAKQPRQKQPWGFEQTLWATLGIAVGGLVGMYLISDGAVFARVMGGVSGAEFHCPSLRLIDGDTFDCGTTRIRLHGIDAPEMAGHCRPGRACTPGDPHASAANLQSLLNRGSVACRKVDTDVYGRTVARCTAGGVDLSCGQIDGSFAVRRYGLIWC